VIGRFAKLKLGVPRGEVEAAAFEDCGFREVGRGHGIGFILEEDAESGPEVESIIIMFRPLLLTFQ
jgi:hypothetical protein